MKKLLSALALSFGLTTAASAATIVDQFIVVDQFGTLLADDGQLSYDDALVDIVGETILNPADGITLSVTLFGFGFTGANDVDFPDFVRFNFFDGMLNFIDYVLVDGVNGVDFSALPFSQLTFNGGLLFFDAAENRFVVTASLDGGLAPVPLPAGLPLALAGLGALAWVGRKKKPLHAA